MTEATLSPELVTSLAVLITALAGLIVALRGQVGAAITQATVKATQADVATHGATIEQVRVQTDGAAAAQADSIAALEALVRDMHAVILALAPTVPPVAPATAPPVAPATPPVPSLLKPVA